MDKAYLQAYAKNRARELGLPWKFSNALFDVESNWNPTAVSPAGAMGVGQFIPETGARYGLKNREDFFDPVKNIDASLLHQKDLFDKYQGNLELVANAYNAGEGAVDRYKGPVPYEETRNYWKKIQERMGTSSSSVSTPPSMSGATSMSQQNPLNLDQNAIGLLMGQGLTLDPVAAPAPTQAQRLASDPWLQMGLGILGASGGSGVQNIASGVQKGLLAAQQGELSSQNIRNAAVQQEQKRRSQALLRQAQLQNAVRLMGGQAMDPYKQHLVRQAELGRERDARDFATSKKQRVLVQDAETGERRNVLWNEETDQFEEIGTGETIDPTTVYTVKESGGRGGAEPTAAQRKATEERKEMQTASSIGTEIRDLVTQNPNVLGAVEEVIGTGSSYLKGAGRTMGRLGIPGGDLVTAAGEKLSPEEHTKDRARYKTLSGLYLAKVRKAVSPDKGAVMSDRDMKQLNKTTQLLEDATSSVKVIEALDTIDEFVLEKTGMTLDELAARPDKGKGKSAPSSTPSSMSSPPQSEDGRNWVKHSSGDRYYVDENGVKIWDF